MLDAGAHIRARRIGGPLRLTKFAIAIGPAMNAALQAARSELPDMFKASTGSTKREHEAWHDKILGFGYFPGLSRPRGVHAGRSDDDG